MTLHLIPPAERPARPMPLWLLLPYAHLWVGLSIAVAVLDAWARPGEEPKK